MVWFQCEDCGEELKKPKLPNHFRICSAGKLSCLDCGVRFTQETVQGHTQCITEAEKYGPKGEVKSPHNAQSKDDKPKKNADVDIHVGLSSHAPWFCSLCNAHATSKQTLLAHADGKKHRAKARAYHAAQNKTSEGNEQKQNKESSSEDPNKEANATRSMEKADDKIPITESSPIAKSENGNSESKKRKENAAADGGNLKKEDANADYIANGEVIQTDLPSGSQKPSKKQKNVDSVTRNGHSASEDRRAEENSKKKMKWKKLVTSILNSNSGGVMKIKRLEKVVFKELGSSEDKPELHEELLRKISSSSRFVIEGKYVRLAAEGASS